MYHVEDKVYSSVEKVVSIELDVPALREGGYSPPAGYMLVTVRSAAAGRPRPEPTNVPTPLKLPGS